MIRLSVKNIAVRLFFLGISLVFLSSCDKSSHSREDDIRQKLVGTWISEYSDEGGKSRTVTELSQDGGFREVEKTVNSSGEVKEATHAGDWSFDGMNFKRKYTSLEGRPLPNSQFGFATYAVTMSGSDKFVGVDNIRKLTIRFVRATSGARP
jgi:hypothetical protein